MKKTNPTFFDKIKIRAACVFTIVTVSAFTFFILDLPYQDLMRFFSGSNYFWFNGKVIALACTSPMFIYIILYSFLALFSSSAEPPKRYQKYATITAILFLSIFALLNILSLVFYLYLTLFTPYKTCEDPRLKEYYVTDYAICLTIKDPRFLLKI